MFNADTLQVASEAQAKAAQDLNQHVRLVAGPGTRKSQTIEQRVCAILQTGVKAHEVAVISFTNASVRDLRERVASHCTLKGQDAGNVRISTLHSLALGVLKKTGLLNQFAFEPQVLGGYELNTIHDSEFALDSGIRRKGRREEVRRFVEAIWSTGNRAASTYAPIPEPVTHEEETLFYQYHGPTSQVYCCVLPGEIVKMCVDNTVAGIIDPATVLGIKFLVVDEYQDLSPVDIQFVDQLIASGINTFVAGDDDQSIYSFRHGSPVGIQEFSIKYPTAGLHVLEHCFRCSTSVLHAASTLIQQAGLPSRIAKTSVSMYADSEPPTEGAVHRWRFASAQGEAEAIADSCRKLVDAGVSPKDLLVLMVSARASADIWPKLRAELEARGLGADDPVAKGFPDHEPGQLTRSLLRIVCGRDDDGAPCDVMAHRILLGLKRGVGVPLCNDLRRHVLGASGVTFLDLFYKELPGRISTAQRRALEAARETCGELSQWSPQDRLGDRSAALVAAVSRTMTAEQGESLKSFLALLPEQITLSELKRFMSARSDTERWEILSAVYKEAGIEAPETPMSQPKIRVMTMHGAKGLSAKVVFVPGLEEGSLPSDRQALSPALLLESARLLFVSITRARAACVLTTATSRFANGQGVQALPSRWIAKTGGPLSPRTVGLTDDEVAAVMASVGSL